MTAEQIEKSPMFRIVDKAVRMKFPWIKKLIVEEGTEKFTNLYFMDAVVDILELAESLEMQIDPIYIPRQSDPRRWDWIFFNQNYKPMVFLSTVFPSENRQEIDWLEEEVNDFVKSTQKNKAIPDEYRLPKVLSISGWRWPKPDTSTITN